jgi:SEC-C motif-containing protein
VRGAVRPPRGGVYTVVMIVKDRCPCGRERALEDCCGRFVAGREAPQTAEELMRSRYSAFVTHAIDYLIATHHPETRGELSREEVRRFSEGVTWGGLQILDCVDGQPGDEQGWVEFVANYIERGEERIHHERSLFRRHQGRWYFHSAEYPKAAPVVRAQPKIGRNDPCPCGSGKKYKKCCETASA